MAVATKIEWADHTWSPWRGCQHATLPDGSQHPGCLHCYAETMAKRNPTIMGQWGPNGTRVRAAQQSWDQVRKWNSDANANQQWHSANRSFDPERPRIFPSVCDPFEDWTDRIMDHLGHYLHRCCQCGNEWAADFIDDALTVKASSCRNCRASCVETWLTMADCRRDLFNLIDETDYLTWILLTKRPENIRRFWPMVRPAILPDVDPGEWYRENVWLVYSASDQSSFDQGIESLVACNILAPVIGVCLGPLVGPVRMRHHISRLDWVIVEGESGPGSRPCRPEWIRSIVKQCKDARVPCFVKQLGANVVTRNDMVEDEFNSSDTGWPDPQVEYDIHGLREDYQGADCRIRLRDNKGGDMSEWPDDLRVRQFPIAK